MLARSVFTGRYGGASGGAFAELNLAEHVGDDARAVAENRRRVAVHAGLDPVRVVWMDQVHGAGVTVVDGPTDVPLPATDGVVTIALDLAVAVLVADCVPVLLSDAEAGVIGDAHAGRAGVEAGVVPAVVTAMVHLGAEPARIRAQLGPAVCGRCYEVPAAMAEAVVAVAPDARSRTRQGNPALDLRAGVRGQLGRAGVGTVVEVGGCTVEDPGLYSYRRDGVTGRFAGLVWLEP